MVRVTSEQLRRASGFVRPEARLAPMEVTYHGRPELVVLSVEDYALLRQNRKLAFARANLPTARIERIANNRMAGENAGLNDLMDD